MILLLLLAQLALGGTPHSSMITWLPVSVSYANDDGTTQTRETYGYNVLRAEVVAGVTGVFTQINDVIVIGMSEAGGTPDLGSYEDVALESGKSYVYEVTAVDFIGESAPSSVSNVVVTPINPNAPPSVGVVVQ